MSVYKNEKPEHLKKSIESMLGQSVKADEIVLVKDGPLTKELDKIIEEYTDNRFNIVFIEKNVGLGRALNIGLKYCKNNIVARMDSDDISIKTRCEKQLKYLIENSHVDLVGSDVLEFEENPIYREYYKKLPHSYEEIKKYSLKRNPICHPSVMFKKDMIESVGGYKHCLLFEDYYLWIRVLNSGKIIENISEPLIYMRVDNGMYHRRGGWKYIFNILEFRKKAYRIKYNSLNQAINYSIPQVLIAILPKSVRVYFYKNILRKPRETVR